MKLKSIQLKNFSSYEQETTIDLDNQTVLVGKNFIGLSTVLKALIIFLNGAIRDFKFDKDYVNKVALFRKR